MKSSASMRQQPFTRKSTAMSSPSAEELHSQISIRLDDEVSSSASGRRFIRRQRHDNPYSRSRHTENGDTSFQFVTVKKLQQWRENVNGLSPDTRKESSNHIQCPQTDKKGKDKLHPIPEVLNSPTAAGASPSKALQNMATSKASHNPAILTNKSVQEIISQISIQTSNLGSPKGTEKKIIDYRTRPGTPHKQQHLNCLSGNASSGKLQNYIQKKNERVANENHALRTLSTGSYQAQEKKTRMLQARISELQKMLEISDSCRQRCDQLEVQLNRQVAMSQKLKQQTDKKQLQIDLLREQLNKTILIANRNTKKPNEALLTINKKTSLTTQKIRESHEYREIQAQINNLRTQNYELCMKIQQLQKQLSEAKKTIKQQSQQLATKQRVCMDKLRTEMYEQKTQRQNQLQQQLNHIGSQLQQILQRGGDFDHQLMEQLQREISKIRKQLSYYHVAIHCTLKQLQQVRLESSMKVSLIEHNELKEKFKRMAVKVRQLTMLKSRNPRNDDLFQLTPQK